MLLVKYLIFLLIAFTAFLMSCELKHNPSPTVTQCVPHYYQLCDEFTGDCWNEYDDCSRYKTVSLRISSPTDGTYNAIKVGDEILIEVGISIGLEILDSVDSISAEFCNNLFHTRLPVSRQNLQSGYASTYTEMVIVKLPNSMDPGSYYFTAKAWCRGGVQFKTTRQFDIYPAGGIPDELVSNNKVNILIYVPMSTPSSSVIYIAQGPTDWPFVDADTIAMHRLDAFRSVVSVDFRGYEQFIFIRDFSKDSEFPPVIWNFKYCASNGYIGLPYFAGLDLILPKPGDIFSFRISDWYGEATHSNYFRCSK